MPTTTMASKTVTVMAHAFAESRDCDSSAATVVVAFVAFVAFVASDDPRGPSVSSARNSCNV